MGMKKGLASKLDITLSEILSYDLLLGLCGGAGGVYLALHSPASLHNVEGVAVGVVGVVIGTVVAVIAVIAAFLDTQFLRKIHQIGKRAERYVSPFAFTAAIGVISSLFLVFSIALPPHAPKCENAYPKQPHLCIENSHTWSLPSVCLRSVADANFSQDFLVRDRLVASWSL
jgi:MFS family permease